MAKNVSLFQAWFVVSTAAALYIPPLQNTIKEVPGVVKDVGGYIESEITLNRVKNAPNPVAPKAPPTGKNIVQDGIVYMPATHRDIVFKDNLPEENIS